jgi:hypothetical protein
MRQGNVGHRFDLGHLQTSQIGWPLAESIERIVAGAEELRHRPLTSNGPIEHSAECHAIDLSNLTPNPMIRLVY